VDWNLLLFDGTSTFTLLGPLSGNNSAVFVQGADTEAFGNFSFVQLQRHRHNGVFLLQQGLFSGNLYDCDASQPGPGLFPGETVVPISVPVGFQNADLHGVMVIGNAAALLRSQELALYFCLESEIVLSSRKQLARRTNGW